MKSGVRFAVLVAGLSISAVVGCANNGATTSAANSTTIATDLRDFVVDFARQALAAWLL